MTNNIAKLIEESGKKIKSISEALDISYPTLSSYNQGIRKPKKENAQKLADYFGVSVAYILGIDEEKYAPSNLKIVTDSFKTSEITSVTPFKSDMEKLKKGIELGEIHLSMPLNEVFSDDFRRILSNYLMDYEETFIKDLIKFMNNQGQKSDIWKTWIQTEEFQIRRADRDRK
ncbi:helix-turn-helix domain-containing protein [Streptococcus equi]|uniref:Putative DNA-binding protein n=3 Tax=Streptococcus equi TaxID=1336 RepID=C0M901_STRE4|nr:helix-turn-helix transcriptional regulator [Streptococcus equi]ASB97651.1 XRE family transcriptional regulator [Streptococcus equi subsp. equi]MBT1194464.1 helix-turn-helix transcriptional regulator [Streptococcus equi subsp. equi]MBT1197294.1 helix-turn-helix transcriptional regulator [Streptococcus equi subsp. equi]MBT1199905.1 helix-turn-helix transcriptional regulator [Streptococcus equi subsp. equi]MBT1202084.1 helix-turn-helix transcriptional regulator [Streptococcus equi subsp. equi]